MIAVYDSLSEATHKLLANLVPLEENSFVVQFSHFCKWIICDSLTRQIIRIIVLILFFSVSGISTIISKHNIKRAGKLFYFSFLLIFIDIIISKATFYHILPNYGIFFAYGFSVIILALINKLPKKLFYPICILFIAVFSVLFGFFPKFSASPFRMFNISDKLGIKHDDYVLFPIIIVSLFGGIIGQLFYRQKKTRFPNLFLKKEKFFIFLGQRSWMIYIISTVILSGCFVSAAVILNS